VPKNSAPRRRGISIFPPLGLIIFLLILALEHTWSLVGFTPARHCASSGAAAVNGGENGSLIRRVYIQRCIQGSLGYRHAAINVA
jgi:hypothetical protein